MRYLFILMCIIAGCNSSSDKNSDGFDTTGLVTSHKDTVSAVHAPSYQPTSTERQLNAVLQRKFNGKWIVVNDTMVKWPADVFGYFIAGKRAADPDYPYIVTADFDANDKKDMAVIVTDSVMKRGRIAIISDTENVTFWEDDVFGAAISVQPKSAIGDIYGKTVKMMADGINVEFFEKSSFVLYWNGKTFKKAWTGD